MDPSRSDVLMHGHQIIQADQASRSKATPAKPESSRDVSLLTKPDQIKTHGSEQPERLQELLALPPVSIPPGQRERTPYQMACMLMEHQKVCLTWLVQQEDDPNKKGGLLAGKSQRISASPLLS